MRVYVRATKLTNQFVFIFIKNIKQRIAYTNIHGNKMLRFLCDLKF